MSLDHQKYVLAGIVPDRKDLLMYAVQHLEDVHFPSKVPKNIFTLLRRYYDRAGGVLPQRVLNDLLSRSSVIEETEGLLYEGYYEEVAAFSVSDHEFRYSVDALKEQHADQLTGEAFATGFEIFQNGVEIDGVPMQGAQEAREYVYGEFSKIDKLANIEFSPEGDMRREADDILKEYAARKAGETGIGVLTGIKTIDDLTGGFQKGELSLVCAYTNQGKSIFSTQCAWNAAVKQGVNVYFATTETLRSTVRRRIIARHSRLPQFEYPKGLDSANIKNGTLSPKEEAILAAVVNDLDTNPTYGTIYIAQMPSNATNTFFETQMKRLNTEWGIGFAVIDYLALVKANVKRTNEREEFNQVLRETKVFSTSFNDGQGVPILSPWQIKQAEYKEALKTGLYGLASLSDTSEAEKSPDQIMSLLGLPEKPDEIVLQFLKVRDGDIPQPTTLEKDYRSTYLNEKPSGFSANLSGSGFFAS